MNDMRYYIFNVYAELNTLSTLWHASTYVEIHCKGHHSVFMNDICQFYIWHVSLCVVTLWCKTYTFLLMACIHVCI